MTRLSLVAALYVLACGALHAQGFDLDSTHHVRLRLELGVGSIASYDNVGSPLSYSGSAAPIRGAIEYATPAVHHALEGMVISSLGNGSRLHEHFTSTGDEVIYGFIDLRYRLTHVLGDLGPVHVSLGGEWDNLFFARGYDYSGSGTPNSASAEGSTGIAVAADFTYLLAIQHRFRASLSLPLLTLVWRPAYGFSNGNTTLFGLPAQAQLEPIGVMWSWRLGFDYDYELSSPLLIGLHCHELFYRYPLFIWRGEAAASDASLAIAWRFDL